MNIELCVTTFDRDEIWMITRSFFIEKLKENKDQLTSSYSKPNLFSFYESFISYPIDDLKDEEDLNRLDFYEAISLMSWALYREWVKKVIDEKYQLECFGEISKDHVMKLFLDNLDCEEGMSLLDKINAVRCTP